jgi:uncharacterized protein (TIGR02271 family)
VDEIPGRLEVEAYREEVEIEHEPVGETVSRRDEPWEDNGMLVVPVYEEQLVVTKRLILKERLRIRRIATTERQLFQDTIRRDHLVVDDPQQTRRVREVYPTEEANSSNSDRSSTGAEQTEMSSGGFLGNFVRKALE